MISSPNNEVSGGAQRPRISHIPQFAQSSGQEAIEVATLAGIELDDWQEFVLANALGERADGKWSAATVGLTIGRQNGKSLLLEVRELFGLFVLGEKLIVHTAHLQTTASEQFRRLRERIQGVPEFEDRIAKVNMGKGTEAIELVTGQRILFTTRMGSTARGFTIDLIVYDEAMHLSDTERSALTPTMAAQSIYGNTQTWYAGSAVDRQNPKHDGVPFAQIRQSGINGAERVAYFEWSAPGDDPERVSEEERADMSLIALANPGLGTRISEEWVEHERLVELGPRGFAVERMGIGDWPDPSELNQRAIPPDAWARCTDVYSTAKNPVCFAIDVDPDRRYASIAAAGWRSDGKAHVEIVDYERWTDWVVERTEARMARNKNLGLVIDSRSHAYSFLPELLKSKIEPTVTTAHDFGQACGIFHEAVVHDTLKHLGTSELTEAVLNALKRKLGDAWAWDKQSSSTDISPLVACTLALWGLQTLMPIKKKPRVINLADALAGAGAV